MFTLPHCLRHTLLVFASLVFSPLVPASQILIGQTAGFTGPVAAGVKEITEGAQLYFNAVNARGGVNGQSIELVSLDDRFDPKLAAENARRLVVDKQVVALFLTRGTPHTEAIMPLLTEFKVPLIGPSTGAMVLHNPVHPFIFNVRATYQREAEGAVRHLNVIGMDRIAILQPDDSFGADAAAGALNGFKAIDKKPLLHERFSRSKPDFTAIAGAIAQKDAQAVIFIGAASAVAQGTKAIRDAGSRAQIITLSNNASGGFIEQMGAHAHGTIVTQVFPNERSVASPIAREATVLARAKGRDGVTPAMMEGFAAAKVLVEGLTRVGGTASRERLVNALNGIRKFDLGGLELSFSPTDHSGVRFSDLSIISVDGKFRR